MNDQRREVEREAVLDAPADEVWEALTDERLLGEWLAEEAELEPEPGGRASFRFADGTEKEGTVLRVSEERELAFTWAGPGLPSSTTYLRGRSEAASSSGSRTRTAPASSQGVSS